MARRRLPQLAKSRLAALLILTIGLVSPASPVSAQQATGQQAAPAAQLGQHDVAIAVVTPSVYWGASVNGAPDDMSAVYALERAVGKRMSIVHWGEPWMSNVGDLLGFQQLYFDRVRARGSIPMVDWGSWNPCCSQEQPDFQLSSIADGAWDSFITDWATQAALWGHPFFLRFDPEMNGWWTTWSEQGNGNRPGDFVKAWRHVHDIFVQQGATNATWVWCPNIVGPTSTPMSELYPGDDYVDWTCMDGYNWGTDYVNSWQTFTQVVTGSPNYGGHNTYAEILAVSPNKPMMIGEIASSENGGNKADWIRDMLSRLPNDFPQIKAVVWFEGNPDDPTLSWSVRSSPTSLRAFSDGIASGVYPENAYATLNVSPIPPPEWLVPVPSLP
jgi:mannan endo-1,4-beta-mannosidase